MKTKAEQLQELIDKRSSNPAVNELLKNVTLLKGEQGIQGIIGYTPVKGKDYFDGKDGYTPIKGKDYFDGKDGKNGETPTPEALRKMIVPLIPNPIPGPQGIKGNDGKDASLPELNKLVSLAKEELKKQPIDFKDIKGTEKLIEFLKAGGFRGGGGSGGGSVSPLTTKGDLYTFSTVNARLPVGTDGFLLSADSTQPTGLKWITAPAAGVTSVSGTLNRITSTGGNTPVIDISATYVGQSSITTLGTITTGVWQGTAIAPAYMTAMTATVGGIVPTPPNNTTTFLRGDGTFAAVSGAAGGTVTSVSVATANGFAGTVANATSTPAITLTTSINAPVLSGNGTAIAAATTTGTGSTVVLQGSPTLTTAVLGSSTATTQAPADNSTKLATTAYVDNAILGQRQKEAVKYASTAALPSIIYANGSSGVGATLTGVALAAISLDSSSPSVNDRVLIKNQASTFQNGIYTVTATGSGIAVFVLTRAIDFDQASDIQTGDTAFVTAGSTLANTTWAYNGGDSPVMGTDALTFAQAAGPGVNTAGNGITITGASIAINTTVTVDKTTAQALSNKDLTAGTNTFPTFNQNTTGNAATVTTNANLTGVVTSTGNATAIANGAITNAMLANAAVANLSGTNTGDQTITLTGAVTGSGTGSFATTLANSIVGIANLSATGTPSSSTYLRGDNTWATVSGLSWGSSIAGTTADGVTLNLSNSANASSAAQRITIGNTQTNKIAGMVIDTGATTNNAAGLIIKGTVGGMGGDVGTATNLLTLYCNSTDRDVGVMSVGLTHSAVYRETIKVLSGGSIYVTPANDGGGHEGFRFDGTAVTGGNYATMFRTFGTMTTGAEFNGYNHALTFAPDATASYFISGVTTQNFSTAATVNNQDYALIQYNPQVNAAQTQTQTGVVGHFKRAASTNNASANLTTTGAVLLVEQTYTQTSGTLAVTGEVLKLKQDASCTGNLINAVTGSTTEFSVGNNGNTLVLGTLDLGHASDTTIARVSAGVISVEGVTIPSISSTNTITNKRNQPRITSAASYTTDTGTSLDVSTTDIFIVTAQAGALLFNNPSGTPVQGEKLIIRIKDNGTARALTYGTQFRASSDLALPTTTVISKTLYMGFIYNSTDTKWDLIALLNNFT